MRQILAHPEIDSSGFKFGMLMIVVSRQLSKNVFSGGHLSSSSDTS